MTPFGDDYNVLTDFSYGPCGNIWSQYRYVVNVGDVRFFVSRNRAGRVTVMIKGGGRGERTLHREYNILGSKAVPVLTKIADSAADCGLERVVDTVIAYMVDVGALG